MGSQGLGDLDIQLLRPDMGSWWAQPTRDVVGRQPPACEGVMVAVCSVSPRSQCHGVWPCGPEAG